ncbi:DUF4892 domain-containing protein [Oceanobacter mangrovi]|uniref:DUF4892 domain-containing protein n=1 Tax=Oceanobacter mangrovi TaxID=2862510 RepID=UPI001C8E604D|nr:DUF4892 domain-containing protein [Oceanobacter mangrovi]
MLKSWIRVWTCLTLLAAFSGLTLFSGMSRAETVDYAGLVAPAGSRLITDQQKSVSNFRLAMSSLKRQAATTFAAQEVRVSGDLHRWAWEVSEKTDLDQLLQPLLLNLAANPAASILYQCKDLDCGSSHFWANEIFGNGRLVGRDGQQRYLVGYIPAASGPATVLLLYASQRGPRQTVIGFDVLTTADQVLPQVVNRETILGRLSASSGWLPGLVTVGSELDVEASAALIEVLKGLSDGLRSRLYLMVHCYENSEMDANQQCSDQLAEQLRTATATLGRPLNIRGQAALVASPESSNKAALRFVFWPGR